MTNTTVYVTKNGFADLKKELGELVGTKRSEVAKRIQEAREMGDISENAEYDSAKQEQAFVEGRIAELEDIIKNSKVSESGNGDFVVVGATVTVYVNGSEETFYIVGAPEADPLKSKISHESPLGQSLLGKKIGDQVEVDAPIGRLTYTILKID